MRLDTNGVIYDGQGYNQPALVSLQRQITLSAGVSSCLCLLPVVFVGIFPHVNSD